MSFEVPATVVIDRGCIWRNGIGLDVTPERLVIVNDNHTVSGLTATNCVVGIGVGDIPVGVGGAVAFRGSTRGGVQLDPQVDQRVVRIASRTQN